MTNLRSPDFPLTAFGDLRTAELSPIFQQSFEYTVDNTELTKNTVVNSGSITQASAMAVVASGTTTASSALLQSSRSAKYRSGLGGLFRFTTLFTTPVANTNQCVGLADELGSAEDFKNGYMIGFIGTTFNLLRFSNDTLTSIPQSSWDDPLDGTGRSGMTIDLTKLNVWELRFQYLGAGAITLCVESDVTGFFIPVHRINYANNNTEPSVHNPNFHGTIWVDNRATTSNMVTKMGSMAYFIEGKNEFIALQQPQFSTGVQTKASITTEVAILTIRNKATYSTKTNFIEIKLEGFVSSIEASGANNLAEIRIVKNATLGGTPSFSDINTTDSVVEIDTAGTTVTGGTTIIPTVLAGKNDKTESGLVSLIRIILSPEETLTVAGLSANSATIKASLLWRELF